MLLDILKPDTGYISLDGQEVNKSEAWKMQTGSYLDEDFLVEYLYPEEFFLYTGMLYGLTEADVTARLPYFERFMNGEILDQQKLIRDFSAGNKQKIGIISTLLMSPQLVVLDEPFNFLDPSSQIELKRMVTILNEEWNSTVLISSHNLTHLTDISTRILLMEKGEIIRDLPNKNGAAMDQLKEYFDL